MNQLYNIAIHAYGAGVKAAALRNSKARRLTEGHKTVFGYLREKMGSGGRWVWVHAASLGEFEQGRPLIERIKRERPELKVLLTFFSPSGYEVRRNYAGADAICYLPFDTPGNARRFVDIVRPEMAVFVKYEFWGNFLTQLSRRGIPTYIISAIFRPSQIFFRSWGGMFRKMLGCFTHIFVQDEASRKLLADVGQTNVNVAVDTRFDRLTDILRSVVDMPVIDSFTGSGDVRDVLVVGSSWQPDEDIIIPWLHAHGDVKSIFAPHEFDEGRLSQLRDRLGPDCRLLSELESGAAMVTDGVRHIIVDCFGRLASIYRKATMAYVGGGFGAGIHNLNEAAVYGVPVIFGPRHEKFKEASDLIGCGGGFSVGSAQDFDRTATLLTEDHTRRDAAGKAAGDYISRSVGATDIIFNQILS